MNRLIVLSIFIISIQQLVYGQMISGSVQTIHGDPIQYVEVTLSTLTDTTIYLTGEDGIYQFSVSPDATGTITLDRPTTGWEIYNGLTPYDYALIQHLIVGNFNSSNFSVYQIIAGDTNNNGYWTTYDVTQIKGILLQVETSYSNSPHWKFIPDDYVFDDPEHPVLTDESTTVQLEDIIDGTKSGNFIGVRTGDVNGSAISHD